MNSNTDYIMSGIINYVDSEVMVKLPSSSRWMIGTMVALASAKAENIIDNLKNNSVVKALDVVDSNGNVDVNSLICAMKDSVNRYGDIVIDIPMVCKLSFSSNDLDRLKTYLV